ncbi:AEC family transporter [Maritimibacter sp. UBA3975]|uniref:AEC family transporter n=1 Tax=Maritimibacter sp. UBA3975 TaxID=1946833 RepID=UPI000C095A70|nr:AEC family transporter [Maritimibacter sp. UBA3975]MAM63302.1 transporter [Maritimibacter sp.]|tara:strand:+ start:43715 stop:44638 length:924 start_codon:yes stop_codon:yes gene_type:complete
MLDILGITFPIFAAIALGYGLVRWRVFRPQDMKVFGGYVMNIALPALIFNAVASRDIGEVFNVPYMAVYLAGALVTMGIAFGWFTAITGPQRRAIGTMGAACPNSGFVGAPLMLLLFPDIAGLILAMNMLVENVIIIPIALALMEASKGGGLRIGKVLVGVIRRPMVIGLLLGLAVSIIGVSVPGPVDRLVTMVAGSAAALALVVIGGSLAGLSVKGNVALAAQISVAKLVVQPLATVGAVVLFAVLGLGLTGDLRVAVILSAAIPMFTIYTVLAQETGHEGLASLALLMATVASFVTLNVAIFLLL